MPTDGLSEAVCLIFVPPPGETVFSQGDLATIHPWFCGLTLATLIAGRLAVGSLYPEVTSRAGLVNAAADATAVFIEVRAPNGAREGSLERPRRAYGTWAAIAVFDCVLQVFPYQKSNCTLNLMSRASMMFNGACQLVPYELLAASTSLEFSALLRSRLIDVRYRSPKRKIFENRKSN